MSRKLISLLFSTEMAAANINGRKTETRRLRGLDGLNEFVDDWVVGKEYVSKQSGKLTFPFFDKTSDQSGGIVCPYGKPGDVIWMRENFCPNYFGIGVHCYQADWNYLAAEYVPEPKWKPSIHMPLQACRYFAEIVEIRLERLYDITEEGTIAEGIEIGYAQQNNGPDLVTHKNYELGKHQFINAQESYNSLWNSINGRESWLLNPWVWVVRYRRIDEQLYPDLRLRNLGVLGNWNNLVPKMEKDSLDNVLKGVAEV
jgi:hypothetical protein